MLTLIRRGLQDGGDGRFIDAEIFARSVGISLEQLQLITVLCDGRLGGQQTDPRGFPVKLREGVVAEENVLALISDDYKFAVQTPDVAYVVERGDSLSVIARRFNTTVGRLVALNQLRSRNRIQIGQRLLLPRITRLRIRRSESWLLRTVSIRSDGETRSR